LRGFRIGETPSEFYYNSVVAFLHFRLKQDTKMADMPEPVAVINPLADHALTGVAIDLLGTGSEHQGIEFLFGGSVIDRDVLETMPDVLVRKENNLGRPLLVDLGD
jgi:hypothetical protein